MQYHIIQSLIQHAKFQKQMRKGTDKPDRSNNVAGTLPNPRQDISARSREIAIALAAITLLMIISFLTLTIYQTYNAYKGFYTPFNQMSLTDDLVNEYIMVDIVAVNGVLNPVYARYSTREHQPIDLVIISFSAIRVLTSEKHQYHIIQSLIQHAKFRNQMRKVLDKPDRSNNLGRTPQNFRQDISVRNREIAIALAVITFLMVISFLTLTTFQTYNAYQGFYTPFDQMSLAEDLLNEYIMVDIVAVNGVLNPVVYFVLDLKFRKEVRAMCSLTTENP
uniref:G-protein coupled receptors family 1 profile domain-containing protein n=1 Tax=Magallana gigas TaxID=29159 RepID=K1R610_MAGGI